MIAASAQKEIKPSKDINHLGDSVTNTGGIMGGRHLSHGKSSPTLLNMGASFPNQYLTIAPEIAAILKWSRKAFDAYIWNQAWLRSPTFVFFVNQLATPVVFQNANFS